MYLLLFCCSLGSKLSSQTVRQLILIRTSHIKIHSNGLHPTRTWATFRALHVYVYEALNVRTLTLTAGAVKLKVFPTTMELVTGAKRLGLAGVLLAVAFPVRS
jgi:hypothetical protein